MTGSSGPVTVAIASYGSPKGPIFDGDGVSSGPGGVGGGGGVPAVIGPGIAFSHANSWALVLTQPS
jgi:hypothetical protein